MKNFQKEEKKIELKWKIKSELKKSNLQQESTEELNPELLEMVLIKQSHSITLSNSDITREKFSVNENGLFMNLSHSLQSLLLLMGSQDSDEEGNIGAIKAAFKERRFESEEVEKEKEKRILRAKKGNKSRKQKEKNEMADFIVDDDEVIDEGEGNEIKDKNKKKLDSNSFQNHLQGSVILKKKKKNFQNEKNREF